MRSDNSEKIERSNIVCREPFAPYQLNALDHFQARFAFEVVYFYDKQLNETQLIDKLRVLIKSYPQLAGRYVKGPGGSLGIAPSDFGVQFVVCQSDCNYPNPSHERHCKESADSLLEKINPLNLQKTPLFTIKLTHFKDAGSALGVSISHGLADAYGLFRLVNDWAMVDLSDASSVIKTGFFEKPEPVRGVAIRAGESERAAELYKEKSLHGYRRLGRIEFVAFMFKFFTRQSRIESRVYRLSAAEVSNMKQRMNEASEHGDITANDALAAHLWHLIHALEKSCPRYWRKESTSRKLLTIASLREKTAKSISSDYLGNAVNPLLVSATQKELSEDDASRIASRIRGVTNEFTYSKLEEQILWLKKSVQKKHTLRIFSGNDPYGNDLFISSFVRGPVYGACFDGNAPQWVTLPVMPAPWVIQIMPAPQGRDIDIHFYLYKEAAKLLDSDFFQALLHRYRSDAGIKVTKPNRHLHAVPSP